MKTIGYIDEGWNPQVAFRQVIEAQCKREDAQYEAMREIQVTPHFVMKKERYNYRRLLDSLTIKTVFKKLLV